MVLTTHLSKIFLLILLIKKILAKAKAWWKCINSNNNNFKFNFTFNLSNSSYKCLFISINSIRLQKDLQPTLGSLGQFLLTNIKIFKFSNCKQQFLSLVSRLTKEKNLSISICNVIIFNIYWAKKPIMGNMGSCFCHHWRRHLIYLASTLNPLKSNYFLLTNSLNGSFVPTIISKLSRPSTLWSIDSILQFAIGYGWW